VGQLRTQAVTGALFAMAVTAGCTFTWQGPQLGEPSAGTAESSPPSPTPSVVATGRTPQTIATVVDIEAALRLLEDQLSLLRGLRPSKTVALKLMAPADLQAKALDVCLAQRPQDALRPETLQMLGLIGSGIDTNPDYEAPAVDWAEDVRSIYNPTDGSITLSDPLILDSSLRLDYLASYLSALRAEELGPSPSVTCCPIGCASAGDSGLAAAAMQLGDTRLAQGQWTRIYGDKEDAARMESLLVAADETSLFRASQFIKETYDFVLSSGGAFIRELYLSGGWPAVDEAYTDPAVSTEQILHPERYPDDKPLPLQAPDVQVALGPSWELRQKTVLGEWRTRQALQVFLSPEEAGEAASDWGGDVLMTYHDTVLNDDLLLLITRWDNLRQAQDFALTFRKYGEARFGERHPTAQADTWTWDGGYTLLERASDQTLWILGPDKTTVEAVRSGVTFPVPVR
jgi:hypothetical protein